MIIHNLIEIG